MLWKTGKQSLPRGRPSQDTVLEGSARGCHLVQSDQDKVDASKDAYPAASMGSDLLVRTYLGCYVRRQKRDQNVSQTDSHASPYLRTMKITKLVLEQWRVESFASLVLAWFHHCFCSILVQIQTTRIWNQGVNVYELRRQLFFYYLCQ
jgi:hypothetical protein